MIRRMQASRFNLIECRLQRLADRIASTPLRSTAAPLCPTVADTGTRSELQQGSDQWNATAQRQQKIEELQKQEIDRFRTRLLTAVRGLHEELLLRLANRGITKGCAVRSWGRLHVRREAAR